MTKRARLFGEATAGASSRKKTYTLKNGLFTVTFPVKAYTGVGQTTTIVRKEDQLRLEQFRPLDAPRGLAIGADERDPPKALRSPSPRRTRPCLVRS